MNQAVRAAWGRYGVQAALVAVAFIWGATFVVVADAIERYPVFGFLFWRFAIAAVAFVVLFPRVLRRLDRANVVFGIGAGLLMTVGYVFQTLGLAPGFGTTPARAAFITGLYVIIVPLLQAMLLRRRPATATLAGAALAVGGMWLLSGVGIGGAWVLGDTFVVVCAIGYSLHMIVLGSTRTHHDTAALAFVQIATVAVVTGLISAIVERPAPPTGGRLWASLLITGVLGSTVAFAVQTYAQRRIAPARTALILVTEPAFGGMTGWLVAGAFPPFEVGGASLMMAGMLVSEVAAARAAPTEHVAFEPTLEGVPPPLIDSSDEG